MIQKPAGPFVAYLVNDVIFGEFQAPGSLQPMMYLQPGNIPPSILFASSHSPPAQLHSNVLSPHVTPPPPNSGGLLGYGSPEASLILNHQSAAMISKFVILRLFEEIVDIF